jgi:hypothetical protein
MRVRSALMKAGVDLVLCNRIAVAALIHGINRSAARAILRKVRPKCLVIGNGNRPFELALWAEAKARNIATVLLPYAEIYLNSARFISLCRGDFDLALPFSENSAAELRKVRPDINVTVVGFPVGTQLHAGVRVTSSEHRDGADVIFVAGNHFQVEAAEILREAFAVHSSLRLRVRPHPRSDISSVRELFDWLPTNRIGDPQQSDIVHDIAAADAMITVRSTSTIDALILDVPVIWLSPAARRCELEKSGIRERKLAMLQPETGEELRAVLEKLFLEEGERERVLSWQRSRLRALGYDRNYFELVRSALRQLAGVAVKPCGRAPEHHRISSGL